MKLKILANNTINFCINRIIEILGMGIGVFGLLLLIALLSFWPDDPNFIFPSNKPVVNILGFYGTDKEWQSSEDELINADEIFITNSTQAILPIKKINNKIINNGEIGIITEKLYKHFLEFLE